MVFNEADYKIEVMEEKQLKSQQFTTIRAVRADNKEITPEQLQEIYKHVSDGINQKFATKQPKLLVKAKQARLFYVLKSFDQPLLDLNSVDDYLDGRVADRGDSKYKGFYYVDIVLKRNL